MDGKGWPSVCAQVLGNIISNAFSAYEDKDFGAFLADLVKVFDQLCPLLEVGTNGNNLTNVVVGRQFH
jgi:hypothetical protein